jgi:hypothetical protein
VTPLPVEHHHDAEHLYYTADQMHAYRAEGVEAEREANAKVCEGLAATWTNRPIPLDGYARELHACAIAIRARKDTK